jgi:hypothetical protein
VPGLRHPALAQRHQLDALTLLGGYFPSQRCFQPPDLAFGAFDHLFPPNQMIETKHTLPPQFIAKFGPRYRGDETLVIHQRGESNPCLVIFVHGLGEPLGRGFHLGIFCKV